jgi:hypothetical protein
MTVIEHSFDPAGYSPTTLLLASNPTVGLSEMTAQNVNGLITCRMKRKNSMPNVENYFNLPGQYYILFAEGKISGGKLEYHSWTTATSKKYLV